MASLNDSIIGIKSEIPAVDFNSTTTSTSVNLPTSTLYHLPVQLLATANCHIAVPAQTYTSANEATKAQSLFLPAGLPMVFKIPQSFAINVLGNSSSGKLYITIME